MLVVVQTSFAVVEAIIVQATAKKSNSNARKRAGMAALKAIPVLFQAKIKRRLDSTWRCILKMST